MERCVVNSFVFFSSAGDANHQHTYVWLDGQPIKANVTWRGTPLGWRLTSNSTALNLPFVKELDLGAVARRLLTEGYTYPTDEQWDSYLGLGR